MTLCTMLSISCFYPSAQIQLTYEIFDSYYRSYTHKVVLQAKQLSLQPDPYS